MLVEGMNAAGPDQSHHVQRAVAPSQRLDQLGQDRKAKELPRLDRLRDAHQVLRHDASRAEIQVADFTVADLSLGKTDGEPRCLEQRARRTLPQPMPHRCVAELDRVAVAARAEPPAVEDDQYDRGAPAAARCHIEGDAS
jgi:hypothetical protein